MKILIDREKTLPHLILVSSVVERKQTVPMLSHLFFELKDEKLRLVGTDTMVEISETITDVKGENCSFTASMEKVLDIARMLPENSAIAINQNKDIVEITSGRTRYKLKTLPPDEFPRIETEKWEEKFKISQTLLKSLLRKTAFAMAVQDVRYYLNGILLQLSTNQLRAIATDGHRLAQSDVDIKLKLSDAKELIVPRKTILEMLRLLDDDEEIEIVVEISSNHIKLTKSGTILISTLIGGKFPEFKGVLEKKPDTTIVSVNRAEFIDTLNRVAILTNNSDRYRGVKLHLDKGTMRITAHNLEQEEAMEEIEVEYDGDLLENGYNVGYLIDVAQAGEEDSIELHLQGGDGICVIKQPGDKRTTWLVMPMRI